MKTITVTGGNLYAIAAVYLGDATQAFRIAYANGLIDPVLTGTMTLIIPALNPQATGGIYGTQ